MTGNKERLNQDIYVLKKRLSQLNESRTEYMFRLAHGKPMVHGMCHEVFRKCGKSNCKCAEGRPHGPYPALSVNKNGKQKIVMVRKDEVRDVIKKSKRYRYFRKTLAKIRKINREIDEVLEQIRTATTEEYPGD